MMLIQQCLPQCLPTASSAMPDARPLSIVTMLFSASAWCASGRSLSLSSVCSFYGNLKYAWAFLSQVG
jgi:hypothetical protein